MFPTISATPSIGREKGCGYEDGPIVERDCDGEEGAQIIRPDSQARLPNPIGVHVWVRLRLGPYVARHQPRAAPARVPASQSGSAAALSVARILVFSRARDQRYLPLSPIANPLGSGEIFIDGAHEREWSSGLGDGGAHCLIMPNSLGT